MFNLKFEFCSKTSHKITLERPFSVNKKDMNFQVCFEKITMGRKIEDINPNLSNRKIHIFKIQDVKLTNY